jgi:hypothetical protein
MINIMMLQIIYLLLTVYSNNVEFLRLRLLVTTKEILKPFYIYVRKSMYLIIPIAEEMIFRKWVYDFLKPRTKFYNIIQAILFALFHMILIDKVKIEENITISFFFSIITGVVYGNIKEKTGNLNWCIFFHSVYCFTFAFIGLIYIEFFAGMIEKVSKLRITEMRTLPHIFAISLVIFIWTLKKIGLNYYSLKGGEKYE